jgi:pimeloyl-ACP methyl ester carboxylesterase
MIFKEYGDKALPKIVLLHAMFSDGSPCVKMAKELGEQYCYIIPDLSAHGEDKSEFVSARREAETLIEYLQSNGYDKIELLFGASMGAVAALYAIADIAISFKTIVLDSAPVYKNAHMLRFFMSGVMLNKQRQAKDNPQFSVQRMTRLYGELGESMSASFVAMSKESMLNVFRSCTRFDFPVYSDELQKRIFFEFGDKDFNSKKARFIQKCYPYVHVNVRKNYGHCEFLSSHHKGYAEMLKTYMREVTR